MVRQKIVAGNWKMNTSLQEAKSLVESIIPNIGDSNDVTKIIIPPFPFIDAISKHIPAKYNIYVGAQNCHTAKSGAFTGEVSAAMLASVCCSYVLVGHSERRNYFKETEADFILKMKEALNNHIKPIYCIGELLVERQDNSHFDVIAGQLQTCLSNFSIDEFKKVIIAYEPVWAIGTGLTATPEQAQEMHAYIRQCIANLYTIQIANQTSILYGGSCNAKNAKELFACNDVDGGLIGGASLKAEDFCTIINSF